MLGLINRIAATVPKGFLLDKLMAKDPAVLFYYQDFLVGTEFMTDSETGQYIRILCHLADKGRLCEKQVLSICKASVIPENIKDKLSIDEEGFYYQRRMKEEKEKRQKFSESRRNNAKSARAYAEHMEDENENINKDVININKVSDKYFSEEFKKHTIDVTFEQWCEWVDYRAEIKKKLTPRSAKMQLKFLSEQPNPAKCIEQSIKNQWQGLFEEKNNGTNKEVRERGRGAFNEDVVRSEYNSVKKRNP